MRYNEKGEAAGAIMAGIFIILAVVLGISFQVQKVNNCKEAGWEYHWATEQCLPKQPGR